MHDEADIFTFLCRKILTAGSFLSARGYPDAVQKHRQEYYLPEYDSVRIFPTPCAIVAGQA
jgi:hypothetical protein